MPLLVKLSQLSVPSGLQGFDSLQVVYELLDAVNESADDRFEYSHLEVERMSRLFAQNYGYLLSPEDQALLQSDRAYLD